MHFFQREVAIDKPDAARESVEQQLDRRRRLLAVWTFEIAILGDRDRGVRRADRVIGRTRGYGQFEHVTLLPVCPISTSRLRQIKYQNLRAVGLRRYRQP